MRKTVIAIILLATAGAQTLQPGKKEYQARCVGCHGDDGSGGGRPSYSAVTVRLRNGQSIRGILKNESGFDLQVLGSDENLHLLTKDAISEVVREPSLMPKVNASATEMRDLLAYVSTFVNDPKAKATMSGSAEMGAGISFADVAYPKPGDWPTYHGNESGNRFSPLGQINTTNVERLAPNSISQIP